jgi:hypothetical protein
MKKGEDAGEGKRGREINIPLSVWERMMNAGIDRSENTLFSFLPPLSLLIRADRRSSVVSLPPLFIGVIGGSPR